jgi:peptide/nickel transport system substrate-binding protein
MACKKILARGGPRRILLGFAALTLLVTASVVEGGEKVFVYAVEGKPDSLDSAKVVLERSYYVTWLLCDALVNISKDGQSLEPGLANSWSFSQDRLQAVVRLRPGVLFHDGTPLDALAVKASFERQFRPADRLYSADSPNPKEQLLTELIEDIHVQDGLTLLFKLKYPGFHYLSQVDVISPLAATRLGKEFGRNPVCTGPFKLDNWSQDRIVLTANDGYWGGRPRVDRVVFRFIPDSRAAVDALLAGEVDFIPWLRDPVLFERVRESPRTKLLPVSGLTLTYLGFYMERPPFNNPLVRRAVVQAIDVRRAILFLGRGAAVVAKGPLPPAMKGYDPSVSQAPYDPQASRDHLSKVGVGAGLTVRLVYNSALSFVSEIAGAIKSDLGRVGIGMALLGKPSLGEMVKAVREREGDMFLADWHLRAPYPERLLVPLFHSRSVGNLNLTYNRNPMLDGLLDGALRLPEGPTQSRIYSQIQELIVKDAPMVFLYHATRIAAHADRVQGLELNLGSLPHDKLVRVDLAP